MPFSNPRGGGPRRSLGSLGTLGSLGSLGFLGPLGSLGSLGSFGGLGSLGSRLGKEGNGLSKLPPGAGRPPATPVSRWLEFLRYFEYVRVLGRDCGGLPPGGYPLGGRPYPGPGGPGGPGGRIERG
jgi:hypothetical protein